MSRMVQVADAVVTDLNGGAFSRPFTAHRHYRPVFDLSELQTLHVSIVPAGVTIQPVGRNAYQHDCRIEVAVQQKLATEDLAEIDALMGLVEEIADHFRDRRLTAYPEAVWIKTEHAPVYALEHLDELRQFTSVLALTFRVVE